MQRDAEAAKAAVENSPPRGEALSANEKRLAVGALTAEDRPAAAGAAASGRAERPAGKGNSLLLPEGGPSEPQPGAAAAIDRLDEIDTGNMGDGVFKYTGARVCGVCEGGM